MTNDWCQYHRQTYLPEYSRESDLCIMSTLIVHLKDVLIPVNELIFNTKLEDEVDQLFLNLGPRMGVIIAARRSEPDA